MLSHLTGSPKVGEPKDGSVVQCEVSLSMISLSFLSMFDNVTLYDRNIDTNWLMQIQASNSLSKSSKNKMKGKGLVLSPAPSFVWEKVFSRNPPVD